MNISGAPSYWDPIPALPDGLPLLRGRWQERNWRNVPGPFYGAMTDNCWVGRVHAPRHVLYGGDDDFDNEFLFRQPRNGAELRDVLRAMEDDPCAGWARDGDEHWTPALVRAWWRERSRLREWIDAKHRSWSVAEQPDAREAAHGLSEYRAYLDGALAGELRVYIYFLDHGTGPVAGDRLPEL